MKVYINIKTNLFIRKKQTIMNIISLLLIIFALGADNWFVKAEIQGSIANDPRTVNVKTKLSFDINQWAGGQPLKAGSYFKIVFPTGDFDAYFNTFT